MNAIFKNFKTLISGQSGYMIYFLIVGIVAIALFFMKTPYSPSQVSQAKETCVYETPLTSDTFTFEGETFDLIKKQAPIIAVQAQLHTHRAQKITIRGRERNVTRPEGDSGVSNWFTGDPAVAESYWNLRFVDVSDDVLQKPPGTRFLDIYIKRGSSIPPNILDFCKNNSVDWKGFLSDDENKTFPPKEIDAGKITGWECSDPVCQSTFLGKAPKDGKYYLYAYDSDSTPVVAYVKRTGQMPVGNIQIDYKPYTIVYYGGWESKHLRLETVDKDGKAVGYRYANPERLTLPENPDKFLNQTKTEESSLQLQAFTPWQIPPSSWWTPECKPAIYLYPTQKSLISVLLSPKGVINYVDPDFNLGQGWSVYANKLGQIESLSNPSKLYPYLYYESKLEDRYIEKPDKGFVVGKTDLISFYEQTLPKLGLSQKETADYIEYWTKYLPDSPYYFIGILSKQNVDFLEPLIITPQPKSILRVRLYYQLLSWEEAVQLQSQIQTPEITNPGFKREGFTVVEWGGLVKRDKNHPFTCSM